MNKSKIGYYIVFVILAMVAAGIGAYVLYSMLTVDYSIMSANASAGVP